MPHYCVYFQICFQVLGFLAFNPVDALGAVELPNGEFLLVFNTLGVYVDAQGRKSRDREIMYPAMPTDVSVCDAKLLVRYFLFNLANLNWPKEQSTSIRYLCLNTVGIRNQNGHSIFGNIQNLDFLKIKFEMFQFSKSHAIVTAIANVPTI